MSARPESARLFLARLVEKLRRAPGKKIVFPEGGDARVRAAAARLKEEKLLEPILLEGELAGAAAEKLGALFYERRRAKGITAMEAVETVKNPLYAACMMVAAGMADGAVGGAVNTTAETVRAALVSIGPAAGIRTVCGVFFVCVEDRKRGHDGVLVFADCAVVTDPTAVEIAEIAMVTAESTRAILGARPQVALLAFSTKGSARHASADKMMEATRILRERVPGLDVDGELQADAALEAEGAASKAPGSRVAGSANALIFPDLSSANISYKLVERLGGAAAYGPLLRGLAKPVSDLSRGCSADDIYAAAIMTALQSEE